MTTNSTVVKQQARASAQRTSELSEQQHRKWALNFWRIVMIAFGVIGTLAAFALGVALVVSAL